MRWIMLDCDTIPLAVRSDVANVKGSGPCDWDLDIGKETNRYDSEYGSSKTTY